MLNKTYLIVLLLIPRHIIIYITTCAFNCKNTIPDGGNHVELLNHRIHVTSSTSIFQPHKSFWWTGSNRWQILPLSKCFTSWEKTKDYIPFCPLSALLGWLINVTNNSTTRLATWNNALSTHFTLHKPKVYSNMHLYTAAYPPNPWTMFHLMLLWEQSHKMAQCWFLHASFTVKHYECFLLLCVFKNAFKLIRAWNVTYVYIPTLYLAQF